MALFKRTRCGKIYHTDFSTLGSEWTPQGDPCSIVNGKLALKGLTNLYLDALNDMDTFVFDMQNEYNPSHESDYGGVVVMADKINSIFAEEYYDSSIGTAVTYPWVRTIKSHKTYTFYWSEDRLKWNYVGQRSIGVDSPKVGLFKQGNSETMYVTESNVYTSDIIQFNGLPKDALVTLDLGGGVSYSKKVSGSDSFVKFKINLFNESNVLVTLQYGNKILQEYVTGMVDGDVYSLEAGMDLYYYREDGSLDKVDSGIEEFLGYLSDLPLNTNSEAIIKLELVNTLSSDVVTPKIKVVPYKGFDPTGIVTISVSGQDTFTGEITLPTIKMGDKANFYLKLSKDMNKDVPEVLFGLDVIGGGGN